MVKDVKDTLTQDMFEEGNEFTFIMTLRDTYNRVFASEDYTWIQHLNLVKANLDMEIERLKAEQV